MRQESDELRKLHPDFQEPSGPWVFNGSGLLVRPTLKIRFAFRDATLLGHCAFHAKIGINKDPNIHEPYIGFAYGSKETQDDLSAWAQKFPYAELIMGLDSDGVITSKSNVTILKQDAGKKKGESQQE